MVAALTLNGSLSIILDREQRFSESFVGVSYRKFDKKLTPYDNIKMDLPVSVMSMETLYAQVSVCKYNDSANVHKDFSTAPPKSTWEWKVAVRIP